MVGWSGRRKALTILLFVAPTLLGLLIFSIFPLVLNVFVSFTNRGRFHPNPDCSKLVWSIVEPTCWLGKPPTGLAEPFSFLEPFWQNYADLLGGLLAAPALLALLRITIILAPLVVAALLNRHFDRQVTRPVPAGVIWLSGLIGTALLSWLLNLPEAYNMLLESGDFIMVNVRTVLYVLICIPLFFVVGLAMALILNNPHVKGKAFWRVALIVPWAASNVAILMSLIWQFFFREQGTVNQLLRLIRITGPAYLNDPVWAFVIVVLVNVWYTYPFFMISFLGGLQSIPNDMYEAASVDGAGWWSQLINITLPLLRPVVLPIIVLSSLTTYKVADVVFGITGGGPVLGAGKPGATEFVMVHAYRQIFQTQAFGRMGAFAVILFVGLFAVTLWSLRFTRITKGAYE